MAREMPNFAVKKALRFALDHAPPNALINVMLGTPPLQFLARQVYFHKRGGHHLSLTEYERRLNEAGSFDEPVKI